MLRETLGLSFSNVDEKLQVELSYTYMLNHHGTGLVLDKSLKESGVQNGDALELWIGVTLRDRLEGKDLTAATSASAEASMRRWCDQTRGRG
jgi:hypothetical protein